MATSVVGTPASATPAATVSVVPIADLNAVSATRSSVAPASPPTRSATTLASPIDSPAASAAGAGRPSTAPAEHRDHARWSGARR
jgi:hypothetical protein